MVPVFGLIEVSIDGRPDAVAPPQSDADRLSERVIVTKNGTPKAVVMGAEEFETWVETLELLSNPQAVKALEQGLKEAKAGKLRSFKDVFDEQQ